MLISNMCNHAYLHSLDHLTIFALFIEVRHLILFHNFEQKQLLPHIILTFVAMCFVL